MEYEYRWCLILEQESFPSLRLRLAEHLLGPTDHQFCRECCTLAARKNEGKTIYFFVADSSQCGDLGDLVVLFSARMASSRRLRSTR